MEEGIILKRRKKRHREGRVEMEVTGKVRERKS